MAHGFIIGKNRSARLMRLFGVELIKNIVGILFRCTPLLSALFYTAFMFCGTVQEIMALLISTIQASYVPAIIDYCFSQQNRAAACHRITGLGERDYGASTRRLL